MLNVASKNATRKRIHSRIRRRVAGRSQTPRLNVYRSLGHIYAHVIDDSRGVTLASASTVDKEVRKTLKSGGNVAAAKSVGKIVAERAKQAGVTQVVFDRGGYAYHGRIQALAEAAREAGLKF
jgi:large subunit ribosomal protein L18